MSSLRFVIARLKNSSPAELVYRMGHILMENKLRHAFKKNRRPFKTTDITTSVLHKLIAPAIAGKVDPKSFQLIMSGYEYSLNSNLPQLHNCNEMLRNRFCCDINPSSLDVDIRTLWEPARMQHIMQMLARISNETDSELNTKVKNFARSAILKWITDNPFLAGPGYMSAMECGLRITVFFYALKHLDNLTEDERLVVMNTIHDHAWWIEQRLSLYSSLGNHTVCECVGLIFAGALFRDNPTGKQWLAKAIELLQKELYHQILDDGGPAEQSIAYHRFVLDQYWLAVDFLEKNNLLDCSSFICRLKAGENFLQAFRTNEGYVQLGDSDEGYALAPGLGPKRETVTNNRERYTHFAQSGYSVIRTDSEMLLTFDHGPLGMAPLYNHGHADALSITLSLGGTPLIVDSGTYKYNGDQVFRKYFKGTRAHNTVTVDNRDQAFQETGFIWSDPYTAKLLDQKELPEYLWLQGIHDGYLRQPGGVIHQRSIICTCDNFVEIRDSFTGSGQHKYEINFHIHPAARISQHKGWWRIESNGSAINIKLEDGEFIKHSGEESPPLGWYSPSYGIKSPCPVLQCVKQGLPSDISFRTIIRPE